MVRGPHDDEIRDPGPGTDRAKQRRDEFLRKRFPEGMPPPADETDPPDGDVDGKTKSNPGTR
jgi:hypothetical protein